MKAHFPFFLLILLLPLQGRPSLAELNEPLSVKTYQVQKIFEHTLGYRVDLISEYGTLQTTYVKNSWLNDPEAKQNEVLGQMVVQDRLPSYMSVYYRGGKVVRFVVYVQNTFVGRKMIEPALPTDATDADFDITALTIPVGMPGGKRL